MLTRLQNLTVIFSILTCDREKWCDRVIKRVIK